MSPVSATTVVNLLNESSRDIDHYLLGLHNEVTQSIIAY
jgi:hypothetical protein